MKYRSVGIVLATLGMCLAAQGRDVYVLRVLGMPLPQPDGQTVTWLDALVFHNSRTADATISVLGTSNGVQLANPVAVMVPAGSTRTSPDLDWTPANQAVPLYVLHLAVPDGVSVLSRIGPEVYAGCGVDVCGPTSPGLVLLPVFSVLTPPGAEQLLLGTDLGSSPVRLNGAFYNGGAIPANCSAEVRSVCDDHVFASYQFTVPANQVIQVNGLGPIDDSCPSPPGGIPYGAGWAYGRVIMDQPGFSYVSVQQNGALPALGLAIAAIPGAVQ